MNTRNKHLNILLSDLRQLTILGVLGIILSSGLAAKSKPNIVLINADDLGYGDLSCYGAVQVRTPHIDRLAKEGRRFTDAHTASAVCSPSRYGLMTGRYPLRRNFWGPVSLREPLTIDTDFLTLGSLLKHEGYATACIGKWHMGFGEDEPDWNGDLNPGPLELGFDYYFGIPSVNSGPPFVYVENHRVLGLDPSDPFRYDVESVSKKYPEKSGYNRIGGADKAHRLYVDDEIGTTLKNKAVDWLKKQKKDDPFFLYFATTNIHHPFTPAPQFIGTSDCGLYGDFIHELDWMVGEILTTLDEMNLTDNTLVIFTSDNGGMLHATGQKAWKNGKLLGYKFGAWEGGHRVPMIARWPGNIPSNTVSNQLISQVDLLATLAAILDRPLKQGEGLDSLDQLINFTGNNDTEVRTTLVIAPNSPKHLSIRRGKWVYIPQQGSGGFQGKKPGDHLFAGAAALHFAGRPHSDIKDGKYRSDAPPGQLYDLGQDPYQTTNVFFQYPLIVKELAGLLQDYTSEIPSGNPTGWINLEQ
jgi:arylsulfatase A-like enzyme